MKRKQRKTFVLLILAVMIITYNRQYSTAPSLPSGLPSTSSMTSITSSTSNFDPEEEFKRLEKVILMDQEDPEVQKNIQKSREFFEGESETETTSERKGSNSSESPKKGNSVVASPETYYIVEQMDTPSKISKKFYGTTSKWRQILSANSLNSEKHLRVGMKLVIPAMESNAKGTHSASTEEVKNSVLSKSSTSTGNTSNKSEYTTQQGDSLYKIAKKLLSNGARWKEIYEWNKNVIPDPNNLKTGLILVINK